MSEGFDRNILRIENSRTAALLIALLLAAAGCFMMYQEMNERGFIDITSPFLYGKLESGVIGLILIIFSTIIVIINLILLVKHRQIISIESTNLKIQFKNLSYDKILPVTKLIRDILR